MKLRQERDGDLSTSESLSLRPLINNSEEETERIAESENVLFAERARKRRRVDSYSNPPRYFNPLFLVPTSKIYERLFSKAGYALNNRLQGIILANFETQMFLHVAKNCVVLGDISKVLS